jgi:hypothetical protein
VRRTEYTQQWLDALRSGEYKQVTTILKNDYGFCCVGIAAHIVNAIGIGKQAYDLSKQAMGMTEIEMWKLIHMNDGVQGERKHTFPEIADKIEAMLDEKPLV